MLMKCHRHLLCFLLIISLCISCKKDPPRSSVKEITSFSFLAADNPSLSRSSTGIIRHDSIYLYVLPGTPLSSLVPAIVFKGKSLSPATKEAQNFSGTVSYTVTAEDGSTRRYTVVTAYLSSDKIITSFRFTAADNPGILSADYTGTIDTGSHSISVYLPGGTPVASLKPAITWSGDYILPADGYVQNFSDSVKYVVTAQDGTTQPYIVKVYTVSGNRTVYAGSDDGYLYAIDALTGSLKWKFNTGASVRACPVAYGSRVFINSGNNVFALDTATGALAWEKMYTSLTNDMAVGNNMLYAYDAGNRYICALDVGTGKTLWVRDLNFDFTVYNNCTFYNGYLYVNHFYGTEKLDAATGEVVWLVTTPIHTNNPALDDTLLVTGGEGKLLTVYSANTGSLLLKTKDSLGLGNSGDPSVSNGTVYIADYGGSFYSVNETTGAINWSATIGGQRFQSPVLCNGRVYASNTNGSIYEFTEATGASRVLYASQEYPNIVAVNCTGAHNELYFGDAANFIHCYETGTGRFKWKFPTAGQCFSGICVTDDKGNSFYPAASGNQQ